MDMNPLGRIMSLLLFTFVAFSGLTALAQENVTNQLYRSRLLGDKAFENFDYVQAVHFYKRYKLDAGSNALVLNDAYQCLITSFLRAGQVDDAERELKEYVKKFPSESIVKIRMYEIEIMVLKGKYKDAITAAHDLLRKLSPPDDRYFRLLDGIGFCYMQLADWQHAEDTYALLKAKAEKKKWKFLALRQQLFAMTMAGKLYEAKQELISYPDFADDADNVVDLKLLNLLILAKEKKYAQIKGPYIEVRSKIQVQPYPLVYMVNMLTAKEFLAEKNLKEAIFFLKDAYLYASLPVDRQQSMRMLINAYAESGDAFLAASTAKRYVQLFPHATDCGAIQLQAARLLLGLNQQDEALKLFEGVMTRTDLAADLQIQAAREAAQTLAAQGKYAEAEAKVKFILEHGNRDKDKGEAMFMRASMLLKQGKHKEAAKEFAETGKSFKEFRERALYWQMHALLENNEFAAARELGGKLLKEFPAGQFKKDALFYLATAYELEGNIGEAASRYAKFAAGYPNHDLAPKSLFTSGCLYSRLRQFGESEKLMSEFLKHYPTNALVPEAVGKRLIASYAVGHFDQALADVEVLKTKFPNSKLAVSAQFWAIDFFRNQGSNKKAEAEAQSLYASQRSRSDATSQKVAAKALYEIADACFRDKRYQDAIYYLNELNEKFPKSEMIADGYFLSGNIYSTKNDYEKARIAYQKAMKLRPNSALELACAGRIGDCYFSLYGTTFQKKYLEKAEENYNLILANPHVDKAVFYQTLYKSGRTNEELGDSGAALAKYRELITSCQVDLDEMDHSGPHVVWLVKAVDKAVGLYIKKESPDAAAEAIRLVGLLLKYDYCSAEEYNKRVSVIREKCKIKE